MTFNEFRDEKTSKTNVIFVEKIENNIFVEKIENNILVKKIENNPILAAVYEIKQFAGREVLDIFLFDVSKGIYSKNLCHLFCDLFKDASVHIVDITAQEGFGYGSIVINKLIDYCNNTSHKKITGKLCWIDLKDHKEKLYHFYKKHEFKIYDIENSQEKRIELIL